jgi:hypothetical protein
MDNSLAIVPIISLIYSAIRFFDKYTRKKKAKFMDFQVTPLFFNGSIIGAPKVYQKLK